MKRRVKDLLLKAAFDEASERERAELEVLATHDSAARAESELLKSLRSDLRGLKDVPACQVSTDQMRDAVLRAGMRRRPAAIGWAWAVGPALGALVAFGVLTYGHKPSPNLQGFGAMPSSEVAWSAPSPELFPKTLFDVPEAAIASAPTVNKATGAVNSGKVAKHPSSPSASPSVKRASKSAPSPRATSAAMLPEPGSGSLALAKATSSAVPAAALAKTGVSDAPVVIVSSVPNDDTGAPEAAENGKGNHVVFGG